MQKLMLWSEQVHCSGERTINEVDSLINAHKRINDEMLDELLSHNAARIVGFMGGVRSYCCNFLIYQKA